jgi:hypothetical protein
MVADDVAGIEIFGVADGAAPAAARFVDDGGVAGVNPAIATAWGAFCADGKVGVAERATADESSLAFSGFHHAQRGPDWHPESAVNEATINNVRAVLEFMGVACRGPTSNGKRNRVAAGNADSTTLYESSAWMTANVDAIAVNQTKRSSLSARCAGACRSDRDEK